MLASIAFAACGTVTGLSDNYKFDLVDGSTTADGSTLDGSSTVDGSSADGGRDAGFDAGGQCSQNQASNFQDYVSGLNGSTDCKACIEGSQCCLPIAACESGGSGCKGRFECDLDCSSQQGNQRLTCLTTCEAQNPTTSPSWTVTSRCVTNDCASKCGQWQ